MILRRTARRLALSAALMSFLAACAAPAIDTGTPEARGAILIAPPGTAEPGDCPGGIIGYRVQTQTSSPLFTPGAYLSCIDGSATIQILEHAQPDSIALSPDRDTVALTVQPGDDPAAEGLKLLDLPAGSPREIATSRPGRSLSSARWSPDGEYIGYLEDLGDEMLNSALMVVHVKTGRITSLLAKPDLDSWAWSPDGKRIVFRYGAPPAQKAIGTGDVTCNVDGKCTLDHLQQLPIDGTSPTWSPDSKRLALIADDSFAIEFYDPSGSPIETLKTPNILPEMAVVGLAWSPDGTKMLVAGALFDGSSNLYTLDLAAHTATPLMPPLPHGFYIIEGWYL